MSQNHKGKTSSVAASSSQWSSENVSTTMAMITAAVGVVAALSRAETQQILQDGLMKVKPHPNKTMLKFNDFYPFYLTEHSDPTNRLLHFIGTSLIMITTCLFSPRTIASGVLSMPLALCVFYLSVGEPRGFAEFATLLLLTVGLNRITTGNYRSAIFVGLCGYGFAWFGHFVFENNRPATFTYPVFSLMSDFMMWFQLATGQIKFGF